MKIVFNLYKVGMGNNGGTRTLIKSAEALSKLGHDVIMYSNYTNKYTWHKPEGIKIVIGGNIPSSDICIATGYGSVKSTINSKSDKKAYYVRGFETWITSKSNLISSYKKLHCIVNSEWLLRFMKKNKVKSDLVYPGLDFDLYYDLNTARNGVGSLFHNRHKTKRHIDAISVSKHVKMLNKDIHNASPSDLNLWYNSLKVWFAPTELEGLHNPPMEASLCGCALVCTDHPRCGMQDYAIHGETALVYPARNISIAKKYVSELLTDEKLRLNLVSNMRKILVNKVGNRIDNMKYMIEVLSGY